MTTHVKDQIRFVLKYPHLETHHTLIVKQFEWLNAYKKKLFSEAVVEFEPLLDDHNYAVRFSVIFEEGFKILRAFVENNSDELTTSSKDSLQCLLDFLERKDDHLKCLAPFMLKEDVSEEEFTFLLAQHVFGPLVAGKCYLMNNNKIAKNVVICPGRCLDSNNKVWLTHTGIGHPDVWHGVSDIYVENGVSIKVNDQEEDDTGESACDVQQVTQDGGPSPKQRKLEKAILSHEKEISETVAQTIVNAFLQDKESQFIPSILTSYGSLKVFMYDPHNDIFLMSPNDSSLDMFDFDSKTFLSDINIIYLWMVLNYGVCTSRCDKIIQDVERHHLSAGFPKFAKDIIDIYRKRLKFGAKSFSSGAVPEKHPVFNIYIG